MADVVAALSAYDAERRPMTAEIVLNNRKGGPERVIDVLEERAPDGFADVDAVALIRGTRSDRARLCVDGGFRPRAGERARR